MITLGKRGDLHARRQAAAFIRERDVVTKLFDDLAVRYAKRPGGYTRVLKSRIRVGDAAPLSIVELVDRVTDDKARKPAPEKKAAEKKAAEKKAPRRRPARRRRRRRPPSRRPSPRPRARRRRRAERGRSALMSNRAGTIALALLLAAGALWVVFGARASGRRRWARAIPRPTSRCPRSTAPSSRSRRCAAAWCCSTSGPPGASPARTRCRRCSASTRTLAGPDFELLAVSVDEGDAEVRAFRDRLRLRVPDPARPREARRRRVPDLPLPGELADRPRRHRRRPLHRPARVGRAHLRGAHPQADRPPVKPARESPDGADRGAQ